MKTGYFLFLMVVVFLPNATAGRKRMKMCEAEALAANRTGEAAPECTRKGWYKAVQCNAEFCWCVDAKTGETLFDDFTFPKDQKYNCKREPNVCLRKKFELLVQGVSDDLKLPTCTRKGDYKPKQCERVPKRKCRKEIQKRQATLTCDADPATLGVFPFGAGTNVDNGASTWTFILKDDVVTTDGEITEITVDVGEVDRTVKFGVYEPCNNICQVKLVQQFEWTSTALGVTTIHCPIGERLQVKTGYHLGISWTNKGAIRWEDSVPSDSFNYCEDSLSMNPGDTAWLHLARYGDRTYHVKYTIETTTDSMFGCPPIDREKVDNGDEWTFVKKAPFPHDGRILAFEFYVGAVDRPLHIGVYRPQDTLGQFLLVSQIDFATGFTEVGYKEEVLSGSGIDVLAGDHIGFTWTAKGVIEYDQAKYSNYYYHVNAAYSEGNITATMDDMYGDRIYSLRAVFEACKDSILFSKSTPCGENLIGFADTGGTKVDKASSWSWVLNETATQDGEVKQIKVNIGTGKVGKTLRFGVYEPCPSSCQFRLVGQYDWTSSTEGLNTINIPVGQRLKVKSGFYLGFSWLDGGSVTYDSHSDQNYCEDGIAFSVGDIATLVAGRYGNRVYDVQFVMDGAGQYVGFDPIARASVGDTGPVTYVFGVPFTTDCKIVAFEFYVGTANAPIDFGVYRRTTGSTFNVISLKQFPAGFPLGFQRVELDPVINVVAGDYFGVSWSGTAPIVYDTADFSAYFFQDNAVYAVDDTTINMPKVQRIYSVRAEYISCESSAVPAAPAVPVDVPCVQCFCVNQNGTEKEGTRTTEPDLRCKP